MLSLKELEKKIGDLSWSELAVSVVIGVIFFSSIGKHNLLAGSVLSVAAFVAGIVTMAMNKED